MSRTQSKVRRSRALGISLTPKAQRYLERRPYAPGQHGRTRAGRESDYKVRLREKQRLRAQYDISEAQLRLAFARARRSRGKTGEALLADLETRLDALVLRAGFARTIYQARQVVSHQHIAVNGHRVDRPSYHVRPGDSIAVAARSRSKAPFEIAATGEHVATVPSYLEVDTKALEARLVRLPERDEIPVICNEQYVVEYYSR